MGYRFLTKHHGLLKKTNYIKKPREILYNSYNYERHILSLGISPDSLVRLPLINYLQPHFAGKKSHNAFENFHLNSRTSSQQGQQHSDISDLEVCNRLHDMFN